jgi:Suppressor of fused protein (SUFU)
MTDTLAKVRTHLRRYFTEAGVAAEPVTAKVTFLGAEPIEVLRFGSDAAGLVHYLSVGCSRHPMVDPTSLAASVADTLHGPRAEVVLRLRDPGRVVRLARSLAILAATPAVDGVVLTEDALIDLGSPLWETRSGPAPFTATLLGRSDIPDLPLEPLDPLCDPVRFLSVTPITATEAAWVRLKGADALRAAWQSDGVDVLDPNRPAAQAN